MTGLGAGIHLNVPAESYRADPCLFPSLSPSIARLVVTRSAKHARLSHPRLNPTWMTAPASQEDQDAKVLHALVLGGADKLMVPVAADDWRLKPTQQIRDDIIATGRVPILARRLEQFRACAAAVKQAIKEHDDCPTILDDLDANATLIWQEGGVWCRGRVDMLQRNPMAYLYNIRFTSNSSAPSDFETSIWKRSSLRAVFLCKGVEILRGVTPPGMRFVACETNPPFGVTVYEPTADALSYAAGQVRAARRVWKAALETGEWSSYPPRVVRVRLPTWMAHEASAP